MDPNKSYPFPTTIVLGTNKHNAISSHDFNSIDYANLGNKILFSDTKLVQKRSRTAQNTEKDDTTLSYI